LLACLISCLLAGRLPILCVCSARSARFSRKCHDLFRTCMLTSAGRVERVCFVIVVDVVASKNARSFVDGVTVAL
jgi:hypothetical protein